MIHDPAPSLPVWKVPPPDVSFRNLGDPIVHLKKDFRRVWAQVRRFLRRWYWGILASGVAVALPAFFLLHPHDAGLVDWVRSAEAKGLDQAAGRLGVWGDFTHFNLILCASIWTIAFFRRSRLFQRLAIVVLMASIMSGATCNLLKQLTGRPRPHQEFPDRFHGVTAAIRGWDFHSFPSGHTSTAFASASALLAGAGPVGMIGGGASLLFSGSVSWARVYKDRHYPTDVVAGIWLGAVFGLAAGLPYRRIRRRVRRRFAYRVESMTLPLLDPASFVQADPPPGTGQGGAEASDLGTTRSSSTQLERETL